MKNNFIFTGEKDFFENLKCHSMKTINYKRRTFMPEPTEEYE